MHTASITKERDECNEQTRSSTLRLSLAMKRHAQCAWVLPTSTPTKPLTFPSIPSEWFTHPRFMKGVFPAHMHRTTQNPDVDWIESLAHTNIVDCYQCGKCSAGCPRAEQMDILPSSVIRLLQYGEVKKAASAQSIWQCVACLTCSSRCPKSVNIAGVMDALKQVSLEKKCVHPKMKRIVAFQRSFLNTIKRNGRINEIEMVAEYKIRGFLGDGNPILAMKDVDLGLPMLLRNKLHLKVGSPVKDKALVKRIFTKCGE